MEDPTYQLGRYKGSKIAHQNKEENVKIVLKSLKIIVAILWCLTAPTK